MATSQGTTPLELPCYVLYLYGFFGWFGRLQVAPGVVRILPQPTLGPLLPAIDHQHPEIKIADSTLWPLWWGRVGLKLVGGKGVRHYVGPRGLNGSWDWEQLKPALEGCGFQLRR